VQEAVFAQNTRRSEISKCLIENCTRQFALIVGRNAKFHSSLTQAGQFTAESAGRKEEDKEEDTRLS
jgi:hypothetical protein